MEVVTGRLSGALGPWPLLAIAWAAHDGLMVAAEMTRRVLHAVADTLPDGGVCPVTRLEFHHGWGDIVLVRIHALLSWPGHQELGDHLKEAVEAACGSQRHRVEIVWDATG